MREQREQGGSCRMLLKGTSSIFCILSNTPIRTVRLRLELAYPVLPNSRQDRQKSCLTTLVESVELTQQCEYVKIRFGRLPKRGYAMLQKDFTSDPYILFVPCSEDDKALWGVYFAPKKDAARVDGIFSEAFFERIRLPGAAGTPEQIVKNLQKNIDILNSEILWNEEKWKVAGIYASVCSLARLFELRRCAAVRGAHFFYCVWVAQPDIPAFTESCARVGGLNIAQDMVLPMRRWKQENPEQ